MNALVTATVANEPLEPDMPLVAVTDTALIALVAVTLVNVALDAFVAPISMPFILPPDKLTPVDAMLENAAVPPVIATADAFWVDIDPKPNSVRSIFGLAGVE